MSESVYSILGKQWKKNKELFKQRLIEWRKHQTIERVENPTRLDRARSLGYKAKEGYVLARIKVKKCGRRRRLYGRKGRKPSKMGLINFTPKSLKWIAEERVQKKFPNMEILNSYYVAEDGKHKWFECILIDPNHPNIINDPKINWITKPANKRRVLHGLTSAGKKSRGLK